MDLSDGYGPGSGCHSQRGIKTQTGSGPHGGGQGHPWLPYSPAGIGYRRGTCCFHIEEHGTSGPGSIGIRWRVPSNILLQHRFRKWEQSVGGGVTFQFRSRYGTSHRYTDSQCDKDGDSHRWHPLELIVREIRRNNICDIQGGSFAKVPPGDGGSRLEQDGIIYRGSPDGTSVS